MTKTEEVMELANDHALAYSLDGDWRQTHDALKSAIKELVAEVETAKSFERERCAMVIENGHFLHDQAPDKLFADQAAKAIRRLE